MPVAREVGDRDRLGAYPGGIGDLRLKGAVTITEQDTDGVRARVGNHDVGDSVTVEVTLGDRLRGITDGIKDRCLQRAITIPAQASFLRSGQTVAYVWNGSAFQERGIQVERRSRDRVLISGGLKPDDLVALKDPSGKE